jgi:hypothetical protein
MSRWIEASQDHKTLTETIANVDECKKLINEVCTEDRCDQCCDYPHPEYCARRCPYFEKEDGVITN